eukprot:gene18027-biopygen39586
MPFAIGTGVCHFSHDRSLSTDNWEHSPWETTTVAGNGSGTLADGTGAAVAFYHPAGVSYSPNGDSVAVADAASHRIRLVAAATGAVTTVAGSGAPAFADGTGQAAAFQNPFGVSYSPGGLSIAVADSNNHRIRLVVVGTGAVTTLAGSGAPEVAFFLKRWPLSAQQSGKMTLSPRTHIPSTGPCARCAAGG